MCNKIFRNSDCERILACDMFFLTNLTIYELDNIPKHLVCHPLTNTHAFLLGINTLCRQCLLICISFDFFAYERFETRMSPQSLWVVSLVKIACTWIWCVLLSVIAQNWSWNLCCLRQRTDMGNIKYCLREDLLNPTTSANSLFAYRDGCLIKFSLL